MAHDVFISHSTTDKTVADAVCAMLEEHQIRCWIAPRDITPGKEWGKAIIDAIGASRVMVLILSASANTSASWDNSVKVWQIATKQPTRSLPLDKAVYGVAFSPDGHWLAAGGSDNDVTIWSTNDWKQTVLGHHHDRITAVAFNPQVSDTARWLASASADHSVQLWPKPKPGVH